MNNKKGKSEFQTKHSQKFDAKEFVLPDTLYTRDIDNRVFQGIILQCLAKISGISLLEENVFDSLIGRTDGVKGIHTEQDVKNHTVHVKVEVKIDYGVSIPDKSEEIQTKIVEDITKMTGLHVAEVHVLFKGLCAPESLKKQAPKKAAASNNYSDEF